MGLPARPHARSWFRVALAVAFAAGTLAACTGGEDPSVAGEGSPETSPPPLTSADSYVFTDAAGIEARLTLDGEGAALVVRNDTAAILPKPGVFVLDARDGVRSDWTVVDSSSVARGERVEFMVERSPVPEAKHVGLVVLSFGGEDYGAFVPPEPGAPA
jgi:hypothetical protein